jgi:hypothetical protein
VGPRYSLDDIRAAAAEDRVELGVVCDEYGIAISDDLQRRFDIRGLVTWYVKLRLEQRRGGQTVVMASLHEPDRDFDERRTGGRLKIEFELRES